MFFVDCKAWARAVKVEVPDLRGAPAAFPSTVEGSPLKYRAISQMPDVRQSRKKSQKSNRQTTRQICKALEPHAEYRQLVMASSQAQPYRRAPLGPHAVCWQPLPCIQFAYSLGRSPSRQMCSYDHRKVPCS